MPETTYDKLQRWFEENFQPDCGYSLFNNIVRYIAAQGASKEDTEIMVSFLLDNIGLDEQETQHIVTHIISGT